MPPMPAPQLPPPGHLDLHVVIVALTPPVLAAVAGISCAISGGGRAGRVLGWIGMVASFALLALFLSPNGVAKAYSQPLAHGVIRVGWWQVAAALVSSLWAAWCWRPVASAAAAPLPGSRGASAWGLRTMVAMLLPLCAMPLALLACEADLHRATPAWLPGARWHRVRVIAVIGLGVLAWWLLAASAPPAWPTAPWAMAVACGVAAITSSGPWRLPLLLAGAAALAPLGA